MNTDIVPPAPTPAAQPASMPAPVDDVKPAPSPQTPAAVKEEIARAKEAPKPAPAPKVKKQGNSVTAAIVATVVIVLGLAALATYAYLQSR